MTTQRDNFTVKTQWGGVRLSLQIGILTLLAFLSGYVVLWADQHNDARYVPRTEYTAQRINDEALRSARDSALQAQFADQKSLLNSIWQELKDLRRESRNEGHK